MGNFIQPDKLFGTIKIYPPDWRDEYPIGEVKMSLEKVGKYNMFNLWANAFHYEIHGEHKVFIQDVSFELLMPLKEEISKDATTIISFPIGNEEMLNNWEHLYYSHIYQFEHLKITNCTIHLNPIINEDYYDVKVNGFITEDIEKQTDSHFFESRLKIKLDSKINSKYNSLFSASNPTALNRS